MNYIYISSESEIYVCIQCGYGYRVREMCIPVRLWLPGMRCEYVMNMDVRSKGSVRPCYIQGVWYYGATVQDWVGTYGIMVPALVT